DSLQGRDLVGGEPLAEGGDDGDAARDTGLKGDGAVVPSGGVEDLAAVQGEQRLVGGDDVFAGGEQVEDRVPGPAGAADQFDGDVDLGVREDLPQVGGDQFTRDAATRFRRVADDDAAQHKGPSSPRRQPLRLLQEQLGDATADRP